MAAAANLSIAGDGGYFVSINSNKFEYEYTEGNEKGNRVVSEVVKIENNDVQKYMDEQMENEPDDNEKKKILGIIEKQKAETYSISVTVGPQDYENLLILDGVKCGQLYLQE